MNNQEHSYYFQLHELHPRLLESIQRKTAGNGSAPPAASIGAILAQQVSSPVPTNLVPRLPPKPPQHAMQIPAPIQGAKAVSSSREFQRVNGSGRQINGQITPDAPSSRPAPNAIDQVIRSHPHSEFGPPISVHALGQYAFCTRAGILASESTDRSDHEGDQFRLSYLPNFDIALISEKIAERFRVWLLALLLLTATLAFIISSFKDGRYFIFQIAFVSGIVLSKWFADVTRDLVVLLYRRHQARYARPTSPIECISSNTPVNWWSLLKSGFESNSYAQPIRHPQLPIEGCPWRVLHYGSLRIPVIRSGARTVGHRTGSAYAKHQLRLAAYALLLTAADHIHTPYGIVFPANSPNGLAIPLTSEVLDRARQFILRIANIQSQAAHAHLAPALPANRAHCQGCPHGKPELINVRRIIKARKAKDQLLVLTDRRGRFYHCQCGDRFHSPPPHSSIIRRQMTAVIE